MKTFVACPTCNAQIEWSERNPWRPFCSERCKLIDLGAWIEGEHRIPAEETPSTEDIPGGAHPQRDHLE